MIKWLNKHKIVTYACVVIAVVGSYMIYLADKTLPSSEGYLQYCAKCINSGDIVYQDFEYLFTPIYLYFLAAYTRLFGYSIYALRVLGVIIFILLALVIYLILTRLFSPEISVISCIVGAFYLQSSVWYVLYDYKVLMDVFAHLAILFMIMTVKEFEKNIHCKTIYWWGFFSSMFFLVKQNMGVLFIAYSCMFLLYFAIIYRLRIKDLLFLEMRYLISTLVPISVIVFIFWRIHLLDQMIHSVFFSAVEAKGGMLSILFGWITSGLSNFGKFIIIGIVYAIILYINKNLSRWYQRKNHGRANIFIALMYSVCIVVGITILFINADLGYQLSLKRRLDVTVLFVIDLVMMLYYIISLFCDRLLNRKINMRSLIYLALFGAFFAQCYGAGMSGGLAVETSGLGLAFITALLLDSICFKFGGVLRFAIAIYCANLTLNCAAFKLVNPCLWWGIDEPPVYLAYVETSIGNLKNIKLSEATANVYQSIYDIVQKETEEDDTIFCFPECQVFYFICDRDDPDVYTKTQWFDISSNESVIADIDVLEHNLPGAIIIHNIYDAAYEGHEEAFNYGKKSGTRMMRDALYRIVNTYSYSYGGTFISGNDNFTLYYMDQNKKINDVFQIGEGTKKDPFQITNVSDLVNLSNITNQGYDLTGVYFSQTEDIDCQTIVWVPIGLYHSFNGNYDDNGYQVYNINNMPFNTLNDYGNNLFAQ